ncbi:MAG: HAMP domain-containing histidine kinase [Lachnospiraceae bacterium]|nr:HAMP domain-containing histidine kinase [Lachnospiraceae bacterium]
MDKLRKSTLFKIVIVIVFMVSLLATMISGIVSVSLYVEHALTKRGKEGLKNEIIESIAPQYNDWVLDYYKRYINGEDTYSDHDFFSEENMNYSFMAQIVSEPLVYPVLTNYDTEDYQYRNSYFAQINIDEDYEYYERSLSKQDIIKSTAYMLLDFEDLKNLGLFDTDYLGSGIWYESDYADVFLINANIVNILRYNFISEYGYDYFTNRDVPQIDYVDEEYLYDDEMLAETENESFDSGEAMDYDITVSEIDWDDVTTAYDYSYAYDENRVHYGDGYEYIYHDYTEFYDIVKQREMMDELEFYSFDNGIFDSYDIYVITDGTYYYILQNIDEVASYIRQMERVYADYNIENYLGYVDEINTVYIDTYVYRTATVEIDWCVKSELTAYDAFYNSLMLRYIDLLSSAAIPVFAISVILLLVSGGFLIAVAGYKKNKEEVSLGLFDRIPYDIIWVVFGFLVLIMLYWFDGQWVYYGSIESVVLGAIIISIVAFFTYIFYSTVVRLKCEGFAFLKKMVICRLLSFVGRLLKKLFVKLGGVIKYLWQHIHLYAKYILCIGAVAFVELLLATNESAPNTAMFIVLEKIVVAFILAYSVISIRKLKEYTKLLADGDVGGELDTTHMYGAFKGYAEDLSNISDGIESAVNKQMKSEMMKTELITNVSHDIKTPLTSIINYVDLLNKEEIDNDKAKEYIEVLNRQSQRLKKLIVDLIDASKASTGNIEVNTERIDLDVILTQINGEYEEQFAAKSLKLKVNNHVEDTHIMADGRHLYRVFDNMFVNIKKYAQDNTRVYINIENDDTGKFLIVMIKNISSQELNITGEELMERFTRGDRSRNTEGSGLGLSIAKSLMELQGGDIKITVDGDLFKVELHIPRA